MDQCIFRHTGRPEGRLAIELDGWICRLGLPSPGGDNWPGHGKGSKTPERGTLGKLEVGASQAVAWLPLAFRLRPTAIATTIATKPATPA